MAPDVGFGGLFCAGAGFSPPRMRELRSITHALASVHHACAGFGPEGVHSGGPLLCSLQSAQPNTAAWFVPEEKNRYFRCSVTSGGEVDLSLPR